MNSSLSPGVSANEWTLAEKIRLLELYIDKETNVIWDKRAEILQKEFSKRRSVEFFSVPNIRQELHRIFSKPNPEHVHGMPVHPRGKEAAELWLKYFRQQYTELLERKKQMFVVSMRRQMDLIFRYQQGKLTPTEIDAILTEAREKDAKRSDQTHYEAALKEFMEKHKVDDLKNIRNYADYCNYMRGERVPTPPAPEFKMATASTIDEQLEIPSPVPSASPSRIHTITTTTRSFGSPEPVLKDIQNNARSAAHANNTNTIVTTSAIITADVELPADMLEEGQPQSTKKEEAEFEDERETGGKVPVIEAIELDEKSVEAPSNLLQKQVALKEVTVDMEVEIQAKSGLENAQITMPQSEWAGTELCSRESILTKTSQTFVLTKTNEGQANAQIARIAQNIQSLAMTIKVPPQMPLLTAPQPTMLHSMGEISEGAKSPSLAPASPKPTPTKAVTPVSAPKKAQRRRRPAATGAAAARKRKLAQRKRKQAEKAEQKIPVESSEKTKEKQIPTDEELEGQPIALRGLRKPATPVIQHSPPAAITPHSVPVVITPSSASTTAGPKKRKRGELDLLSPISKDSTEDAGPPARNLRRTSSQLSPAPSTASPERKKEREAVITDDVKAKEESEPQNEEAAPAIPPAVGSSENFVQKAAITPPILSEVAVRTKLRSMQRSAHAGAIRSTAVFDMVGENDLFLRPGNHTSNEMIPKFTLLSLWKDIRTHRYSYVFDQPVTEAEVPGYHSAIKKPMDLKTLRDRIETGAVQTFGQLSHDILLIFANAVMYNSTGHHVNTYAKEMLTFALKCVEVIQYPSGMWTSAGGTASRQSNGSESEAGDSGRISRGSSGISSLTGTPAAGSAKLSYPQRAGRAKNEGRKVSSASTPTLFGQEQVEDYKPSTSSSFHHQSSSGLGAKAGGGEAHIPLKRRSSQRSSGGRQQ